MRHPSAGVHDSTRSRNASGEEGVGRKADDRTVVREEKQERVRTPAARSSNYVASWQGASAAHR